MVTPRAGHTATLLPDGKVLVAGGGGTLASAELYDPNTGRWTSTGKMVDARDGHTATLLPDGKVLVAGGFDSTGRVPTASAELFDPGSGTWTTTGRMIEGRAGHTATLLRDGTVLVAGGGTFCCGNGNPAASAELYDPATGRWTATGRMTEARHSHTATLLPDGRVLVAGGVGSNTADVSPVNTTLASAELYEPASGSWAATRTMDEGRARHTATLLLDGTVLVTRLGQLGSAELYDPRQGSWADTGNMDVARFMHTATRLPDGRVLVVGGYYGAALAASAELYDPVARSWTTTRSMITPRQDHTATLLATGRVLVAGGIGNGALASAELYDPGSLP